MIDGGAVTRILFLAGRTEAAGRHRRWAGVGPTARQLELACAVAGAGHQPVLVADPDLHLPADIARLVARQAAGAVVADVDHLPHAVLVRVERALGDAFVATSARTVAPVDTGGAGAVVHQGDVRTVLGRLGLAVPAGSLPLAPRDVVSPEIVALAGVEVAFHGPDGTVSATDPDRVLATVSVLARSCEHPFDLVGVDLLPRDRAIGLLHALDPVARGRVGVEVDVGWWSAELSAAAAVAGARVALRLGPGTSGDGRRDEVTALAAALATAQDRGLQPVVRAELGDDLDVVERLAGTVLAARAELAYVWDDGVDEETAAIGTTILASADPAALEAEELLGPRRAVAELLGQPRPPGTVPVGGLGAVLLTACGPDDDEAGHGAIGCGTEVFALGGPGPGSGRPHSGRHWPAGPALLGDGTVDLPGLRFDVMAYAEGRHVEPFDPLALVLTRREDVEAFLADADVAWHDGRFPRALLSPLTVLADACAWSGPATCTSPWMLRAAIDADGVRTARFGPVVGRHDDEHHVLVRGARAAITDARTRRGCAACRVRASCSQDLCLSGLLDDATYCAARRGRPWLAAYVDAVEALRALGVDDPEAARVAGFGGPLHPDPAGPNGASAPIWPDRPPLVLVELDASCLGYVVARRARLRLTHDAAVVTELLLSAAGPDDATSAVATRFGLSGGAARAAVARVADLLACRGVTFPAVAAEGAA
jgi:hypothetical protein